MASPAPGRVPRFGTHGRERVSTDALEHPMILA